MLKEIDEACNICSKLSSKHSGKPYNKYPQFTEDGILPCWGSDTECLPKDRAIIVLLDRLLKKLD